MSHAHHDDIADIRRELWRLLADVRNGEMEPEVAEQAISAVDSLIDVARLEGELTRGTVEPDDDAESDKGERRMRRKP